MNRTELKKFILKQGYVLKNSKKHFVFEHPTRPNVVMPNHNKLNKYMVLRILKNIKEHEEK